MKPTRSDWWLLVLMTFAVALMIVGVGFNIIATLKARTDWHPSWWWMTPFVLGALRVLAAIRVPPPKESGAQEGEEGGA